MSVKKNKASVRAGFKAEITIGDNRQKLVVSGSAELGLPETRDMNWTLGNIGFCETYPIGCRRYYAAPNVSSQDAVAILQAIGFAVRLTRLEGQII